MADRYGGAELGVRLSRDDHEWLATVARKENISAPLLVSYAVWYFRYWQEKGSKALENIIDSMYRAYQDQARRQRHMQQEHQKQLRRERNLRRASERQLRHERNMRRVYEIRLRNERARRRAHEKQPRQERDHYGQRATAGTAAQGGLLYGPKVARLLDLAVCSDSDGEATAALAKARALRRLTASFPA
jgi:hypothetical protein